MTIDPQTLRRLYLIAHYAVPAMAIVLALAYLFLRKREAPFWRGMMGAALAGLAVLAVANFYYFGKFPFGSFVNYYDMYHYHVGAKYAPEVKYDDLYHASLIADHERGRVHNGKKIRNLQTGAYKPVRHVHQVGAKYKRLFTPERWEEFREDISFFSRHMHRQHWIRALNDYGYNAGPVWTMLAGGFAARLPTTEGTMRFLALLDPLLLLIAFACLWWAYGPRTALFTAILLGTHYMMSITFLKGCFLRLDWVVCMVIALCMLKKTRYKTAGALMAYAALARVFPVIFLFGLGAKGLVQLVWERKLNRNYVAFFLSFGVTVGVLVGASIIYFGGLDLWHEYMDKIRLHNTVISTWRVGFKYLFLQAADAGDPSSVLFTLGMKSRFDTSQTAWWSIQAAMLFLCLFLVRRLDDDEALAFGFVPAFFLVAPTYYYYVMLLVPFLFFVTRLDRPTRAIGVALMFLISIASYVLAKEYGRTLPLFFRISCMLMGLVVYMMALGFYETLRPRRDPGDAEEAPDKKPGETPEQSPQTENIT